MATKLNAAFGGRGTGIDLVEATIATRNNASLILCHAQTAASIARALRGSIRNGNGFLCRCPVPSLAASRRRRCTLRQQWCNGGFVPERRAADRASRVASALLPHSGLRRVVERHSSQYQRQRSRWSYSLSFLCRLST